MNKLFTRLSLLAGSRGQEAPSVALALSHSLTQTLKQTMHPSCHAPPCRLYKSACCCSPPLFSSHCPACAQLSRASPPSPTVGIKLSSGSFGKPAFSSRFTAPHSRSNLPEVMLELPPTPTLQWSALSKQANVLSVFNIMDQIADWQ